MSTPMFTSFQQKDRLHVWHIWHWVGWGLPDFDSGLASHHVHTSGPSLMFFIYLTSHQQTSPSARATQQTKDKTCIITISFNIPLHSTLISPKCFLSQPLPIQIPKHLEIDQAVWKLTNLADWTHPNFQPNSPPIRRTLTHVAPVCRTALDLRQDLQTSMVVAIMTWSSISVVDVCQKGCIQKQLVNLGKFQFSEQIMSNSWKLQLNSTQLGKHDSNPSP